MSDRSICRLCMGTERLHNLSEINKAMNIAMKINFCVNIEIHPEDGIPTIICKPCLKAVKKFYRFKQKCLKVAQELRSTMSPAVDGDVGKPNISTTLSPYFLESIVNDSRDTFDLYMTSHMNIENDKTDIPLDEVKIKSEKPFGEKPVNIENSYQSHINHEPFKIQCEVCGCVFEAKIAFRKHLSSHRLGGTTKSFQCNFCPKRFTRAENSIIHMRSHFGIKPFICEICGQSSTKRQDLIRHMKIHSDVRSHACQNCGRCFKRSFDLYQHMRTHTGARPYKCLLCGKDYTSHSGLRKHHKTHSPFQTDVR